MGVPFALSLSFDKLRMIGNPFNPVRPEPVEGLLADLDGQAQPERVNPGSPTF